jgi:hypothetical protein
LAQDDGIERVEASARLKAMHEIFTRPQADLACTPLPRG